MPGSNKGLSRENSCGDMPSAETGPVRSGAMKLQAPIAMPAAASAAAKMFLNMIRLHRLPNCRQEHSADRIACKAGRDGSSCIRGHV
ncbi:hypothetical protein CDZ95_06850 [Mameliella alba]|nr:hypothetical protein CDZ95_06850 [Mameliella alba]